MTSQAHPIYPSTKHYIHFSISPPVTDALTLRKCLVDRLEQTFGITSAFVDVDVLWLADNGKEVIIRLHPDDAPKVLAAVVSSMAGPRLSLVRESPILAALGAKLGNEMG